MKNYFLLLLIVPLLLFSCRNKCKDENCNESGYCEDGQCICFGGKVGIRCTEDSPLTLDSISLFLDSTLVDFDWEFDDPNGVRPDIIVQFSSLIFDGNDCGKYEYRSDIKWNADPEDFPMSWFPNIRLNETTYDVTIADSDFLACGDIMDQLRFQIDRNSANPVTVTSTVNSSRVLRLHWSWNP